MLLTYPIVFDATRTSEQKAADLYRLNESGTSGFYPVGANNFWHGGVHFESEAPVQSIADGTIIAYRINRVPLECEIRAYSRLPHHMARGCSLIAASDLERFELDEPERGAPPPPGAAAVPTHYSNGFVLVRHEYVTPRGNQIQFYCLYMHLLPLSHYTEGQKRHAPSIFHSTRYAVKSGDDGGGLEIRAADDPAKVIGTIPFHFRFKKVAGAEPKTHKGVVLERVELGSITGYAATQKAAHLEGDLYLQTVSKAARMPDSVLGLNVRERPDAAAPVVRILPKGERVFFKRPVGKGYNELSDGGFVVVDAHTIASAPVIEPEAYDSVVLTEKKVKKGEIIGHPGPCITTPGLLHFEIFMKEPPRNRTGEHWGPASFVIPAGSSFMKKEADGNPSVQVDLPQGIAVEVSERDGDYLKLSATLPAAGWALRNQLGDYQAASKSYLLQDDLDVLSLAPGSPAGAATRHIGAKKGQSLSYLEQEHGAYRLVGFGPATTKQGWMEASALPEPKKGKRTLEAPIATLLEKNPAKNFKFVTPAGSSADEVIGREHRDEVLVMPGGEAWMEVEYAPHHKGWIRLQGPGVARQSDYDWPGWRVVEEQGAFSDDGFCDVADLLALFQRDEDPRISLAEIKQVLASPELAARLHRSIARHPTEWDAASDDAMKKWRRLAEAPWLMHGSLLEDTLAHIRKLQWYHDVPELRGVAAVYHVHPVAFIEHLKRLHGITAAQLRELFPAVWVAKGRAIPDQATIDRFLLPLNETLQRYGMTSRLRQCHFLAQIRIESNLHFLEEEGEAAHTDPRFPPPFWGRGLLQLTYKENYLAYNRYRVAVLGDADEDLLNNPDKLRDDAVLAADSAGWYWSVFRSINRHCDADKVDNVSKLVNYGSTNIDITKIHHHQERRDYAEHAKALLLR